MANVTEHRHVAGKVTSSSCPKCAAMARHVRTGEVPRAALCGRAVQWWEGEYEGECELPVDHEGDHWDGLSWFNDDNECTDHAHAD